MIFRVVLIKDTSKCYYYKIFRIKLSNEWVDAEIKGIF